MSKEDALRRILQRNATKERRLSQIPLTVELKVPKARLNCVQKETIKMMFVEQKWCHNYITGLRQADPTFDIFKYDYKELQNITHLDKDKNVVEVEITHLTQQMKQGFVSKYRSNVKTLATQKKKGEKIGTIGFITEGKSIYLKQYGKGKSYEVVGDNKIKLAGISKPVPVNGLKKQLEWVKSIDEDFEFSSATFDRDKVGDYFFHLTLWVSKEKYKEYKDSKENIIYDEVGIDFGCETTITTSYGAKINPVVNETERLKRLQAKKPNQVKHSNRWKKTIVAIRKEYRHISNKKNDIANKEATNILRKTRKLVIQDEQIANWQETGHGKAVAHSVHGRMKTLFERSDKTLVLDKWIPTTKMCPKCGHMHMTLTLDERTYVCSHCHYEEDRDIHAANNMLFIENNFDNVTVGPDGSSFNRADFDERLAEIFNLRPADEGCSTSFEIKGG